MQDIERRFSIEAILNFDQKIILFIYAILVLEYDLYEFFHFGAIIPGYALTFLEILLLLFVIISSRCGVKKHYIMYSLLFLGIIWTFYFYPECKNFLKDFFFAGSSIKKIFLLPLAVHCIKSPNKFTNRLYKISIIEGYIHIFCNGIWGYSYTEWGVFNYMVYGMALITPTCMVMQRAFSRPSKWNLLTLIIFESNIVIYGHRGALLVSIIMMSIFFIRYVKVEKILLIVFLGIIASIAIYFFKENIIEYIFNVMESLNIESRTLKKLLSGDITNDSERNTIWSIIGNGILTKFPFGNGIGADRVLLAETMRDGLYAHNFIFELCYNFGLIIGIGIVISIIVMIYKSLTKIKDEEWYRLIVSFLIPSVVTLLTSSSIYQHWLFWLSVGFYFCYFGRKRTK